MKWLMLLDENHLQGGFQTCLIELATELIGRNHKVDFLYFRKNPFGGIASAHPDRCRVWKGESLATRSLRPSSLRAAWRHLKQIRPDAIFFCTTGVPNFLPYVGLSPLCGVRHVIAQFGTEVELPPIASSRRYLGGLIPGMGLWRKELLWSAKVAYQNMSLALFNNEPQLNHWREAMGYPLNRCVIWNYPVDLAKFVPSVELRSEARNELKIHDDEFVVGGVGGLNRQKSFDISIRALAELRDTNPRFRLVIAGDGPMRTELEQLSQELGVASRVNFLGPRSDVHRLMNAFDAFCMPSTHPNETLGIVFVEAQACGVPIVAPDLPGPRRVARDGRCGLVVAKGDCTAFASAWVRLAQDQELRVKLRREGLKAARESDRASVLDGLLTKIGTEKDCADRPLVVGSTVLKTKSDRELCGKRKFDQAL